MLSRRIQRFMRRRNSNQVRKKSFRRGDESKGHIICYECRKPGHTKYECPNLSKDKPSNSQPPKFKNQGDHEKKRESPRRYKKAMVATWDDEDSSSQEEEQEEQANLCLMAQDEPKVTLESSSCSTSLKDDDHVVITLLMNCKMHIMS